jgi:pyridoxine 5'-phosphate synthase PdxJ
VCLRPEKEEKIMPDDQMCVRQRESIEPCVRVIVELNIKVMVFWDATPCSLINTVVSDKNAFYILGVE